MDTRRARRQDLRLSQIRRTNRENPDPSSLILSPKQKTKTTFTNAVLPRKKIPRVSKDNKPYDHAVSLRREILLGILDRFFPQLAERAVNGAVKRLQDSSFTIRPEWKLWPARSLKEALPVVSDQIVPALESGAVASVVGVRAVVGPDCVELDDGSRVVVDTIIYCTGYRNDFSLLEGDEADPCRGTKGWTGRAEDAPLPELYRNLFSLEFPDSLAFMGCAILPVPAFQLYDLASMAIAQVWSGGSALPAPADMRAEVEGRLAVVRAVAAEKGVLIPSYVNGAEWMAWADETAGTGVSRYLGWGADGVRFWLGNWRLCGVMMGGLLSPHIFRVFETGKRKVWDGAVAEIWRVNGRVGGEGAKTA